MFIKVSYESATPIYEQIENAIRREILHGNLPEGGMLPSIRTFARELRVGIITVKRAYDDLCAEGFCYAQQGKGVFVAKIDRDKTSSYAMNELRTRLKEVLAFAEESSVSTEKIIEIIKQLKGE